MWVQEIDLLITRLVREHLYPLRHFVGPVIIFNYILKTKRSKEGNVLLNHIVKIDGAFSDKRKVLEANL